MSKSKKWIALKNKITPFSIVFGLILLLYTIVLAVLIGWGLGKSFQSTEEYFLSGHYDPGMPKEFTLENYKFVFSKMYVTVGKNLDGIGKKVGLMEMFMNSILYAVGGAFVQCLTALVVAYLTTKYNNKFNSVVDGIFYFALLFPIVGSMPSTIQITRALGTYDTWIGMYLMKLHFLGSDYLIFKATFKTMDNGYAEAAKIDGASHFAIMTMIIFPLVKTTFMIMFVMGFIGLWNDYQAPMIYLESHPTASYGLYIFNSSNQKSDDGMAMDFIVSKVAGYMVLLVPTFVIFLFLKDKMMGNLTIGGLKG